MILTTALLFGFAVAGSVYGQDSTKTKSEIKQKNNKKTAGKETQNTEQPAHAQHFVDKDGDGYNDNAPDHDGDGIPNGLDPDWKKLQKSKLKKKAKKPQFVDLDGDGINDNLQSGKTTGSEVKGHATDKAGESMETTDQKGKGRGQMKQKGKQGK